eukprot:6475554-Amphidinium_carterae.1
MGHATEVVRFMPRFVRFRVGESHSKAVRMSVWRDCVMYLKQSSYPTSELQILAGSVSRRVATWRRCPQEMPL